MILKKNIFPFYHTISDKPLQHIKNLYPVKSVDQFKRELDFFETHYTNISLKDLIKLKNENNLVDNNYFHLSFDDGLKECNEVILEILKERNLDATFFINPNFIGNKDLFYRYKVALIIEQINDLALKNRLLNFTIKDTEEINQLFEKHKKSNYFDIYMSDTDIKNLIKIGFTIGAHSMNHPYYHHISFEEQVKETEDSLNYIQQHYKLDYKAFSFPFTDFGVSKDFFNEISVDLSFGTAGIKDDIIATNIQRLPMDNNLNNPAIFIYKNLLLYQIKKALSYNIVKH